jgi:HTH-type transcriptional regulator/antitoxin HigA
MRSRTIIAIPPGATIKEQLDDRGMTQKEFALRMDMSEKHISQLINGEVRLTPAVALLHLFLRCAAGVLPANVRNVSG